LHQKLELHDLNLRESEKQVLYPLYNIKRIANTQQ